MATVFLVGELGPSHRDLPPLLTIAHRLNANRHRVMLVLRDVMGATVALANQDGYTILQAPVWRAGKEPRAPLALTGYGDYLGAIGFDDVDEIARVVEQWRILMDNISPDLIVAHNSPGVCLAATGRIPVIAIGDGYTVPPADVEAFPELIAGRQATYDQADLLANVNLVLTKMRRPKMRSLPSLFFTAGRFPLVLPGLDPYGGWRHRPSWGPLDALPKALARPEMPSAYVSLATEFYEADAALTALTEKGIAAKAFLRGLSPDFLEGLSWEGVAVLADEPDPIQAVGLSSLVVHNGSLGLTTICTAVGRPQLIFPKSAEQAVTAARAAELGIATVVHGDPTPERVVRLLGDTERLADHAMHVAKKLDRSSEGALHAIEKKAERVMSIPV